MAKTKKKSVPNELIYTLDNGGDAFWTEEEFNLNLNTFGDGDRIKIYKLIDIKTTKSGKTELI